MKTDPQAERPETAAEWDAIEALLDRDPRGDDFNTTHEICTRYAGRSGPALTVVHDDGTREVWSYADLDRAAARSARVFADLGLRAGDSVAGLLARQVESWIVALGAWRSGLIYVPLFGGFSADAIRLRMEIVGARAVVTDHRYLLALQDALESGTLDPAVLVVGGEEAPPRGGLNFRHMVDAAAADGPIIASRLDDTATILFTSGTSGTPKGCRMTHAAFVSTMPYVRHVLGAGGPVFSTADPSWAYGLLTTGASVMALGIPRVMYSGPFSPERWYDVVADEQAAVMATAPAALRRLASGFEKRGVPKGLQSVAAAGEPLTETVARDWAAAGAPAVRNGYGLSEVGMVLADTTADDHLVPGSLARELPGFDAVIVGRDGSPSEPGEPGLLAIRRPRFQMSSGYVNVPALWEDRWRNHLFVTEDRVERKPNGRWTILGRDDDMIIVSGHNISPVEVENAAMTHPEIAEVAAVPWSDPARGDVLRVVVVLAGGTQPSAALVEQVRELVARKVGRYARPHVVDFVTALPRTEVGKLRRAALR